MQIDYLMRVLLAFYLIWKYAIKKIYLKSTYNAFFNSHSYDDIKDYSVNNKGRQRFRYRKQ